MNPTATISGLADLLVLAGGLQEHFKHGVWWRGQADSEWGLTPSVYRDGRTATFENSCVGRFQSKAPVRYGRCPALHDAASWLFLMQHYRLPTRLLDWTQSPLVAAFFAVTEEPDKPGAVWAMNPYGFNQQEFGSYGLFPVVHPTILGLLPSALPGATGSIAKVAAVMPHEVDIRMLTQQSVFTLHGTREPMNELQNCGMYFAKYEIPAEVKTGIFLALDVVGVNRASLFPDLENLARDLSMRQFDDFPGMQTEAAKKEGE